MAITVRRPISTRLRTRDHHALLDALKVGDCCESRNTLMACECDFIEIVATAI